MTPPDIADLCERLRGIDEESMYQQPATTHAVVSEAATALEALSARVMELEAENVDLPPLLE